MDVTTIRSRLLALLDEVKSLTIRHGRDPQSVRVIAVSKTHPPAMIESAIAVGQTSFGENYAQEFSSKYEHFAHQQVGTSEHRHSGTSAQRNSGTIPDWHFIGHLQSNKAKLVADRAELIHTIDRLSLAQELQKLCAGYGFEQNVLVQIKVSADADKTGCPEDSAPAMLAALKDMPRLRVLGFMAMATLTTDKSLIASEFARVRKLLESVNRQKIYPTPLTELSMGMSGDFAIAIAEGATLLRIGTRIFGERG